MKKKLCALVLGVFALALLCGCQQDDTQQKADSSDVGKHQQEVKGDVKGDVKRELNEVDDSQVSFSLDEYDEELARYYTADITLTESEISGAMVVDDTTYDDVDALQEARAEQIVLIQEKVPAQGMFETVEMDTNTSGLQLHAATEDSKSMFSAAMYLDSSVQLNYVLQWTASEDVDFEKAATDIQYYTGIQSTGNDIAALQNAILEEASSGQYSFILTDEEGMNGFYISVADFGAAGETWQLFVQRYMIAE